MQRRNLLKGLLALPAAPIAAKAIANIPETYEHTEVAVKYAEIPKPSEFYGDGDTGIFIHPAVWDIEGLSFPDKY